MRPRMAHGLVWSVSWVKPSAAMAAARSPYEIRRRGPIRLYSRPATTVANMTPMASGNVVRPDFWAL